MCELYGMFGSLFGCASIWTMVMIALDRYNVIVKVSRSWCGSLARYSLHAHNCCNCYTPVVSVLPGIISKTDDKQNCTPQATIRLGFLSLLDFGTILWLEQVKLKSHAHTSYTVIWSRHLFWRQQRTESENNICCSKNKLSKLILSDAYQGYMNIVMQFITKC